MRKWPDDECRDKEEGYANNGGYNESEPTERSPRRRVHRYGISLSSESVTPVIVADLGFRAVDNSSEYRSSAVILKFLVFNCFSTQQDWGMGASYITLVIYRAVMRLLF